MKTASTLVNASRSRHIKLLGSVVCSYIIHIVYRIWMLQKVTGCTCIVSNCSEVTWVTCCWLACKWDAAKFLEKCSPLFLFHCICRRAWRQNCKGEPRSTGAWTYAAVYLHNITGSYGQSRETSKPMANTIMTCRLDSQRQWDKAPRFTRL